MHEDEFNWNHLYTGTASDCQAPDPLLLEIIGGLPPGRALDIGCGAGGMVIALAERGWQVTGIDLADLGIASATRALEQRGLAAELHVADATKWQPTSDYDLITSSFALPGKKAERAVVFAMARSALAPGGAVALKHFDRMKPCHPLPGHFENVTVAELTAAFAGFEILRAEVVPTPVHDHHGTGAFAGERWTAALLYARKP